VFRGAFESFALDPISQGLPRQRPPSGPKERSPCGTFAHNDGIGKSRVTLALLVVWQHELQATGGVGRSLLRVKEFVIPLVLNVRAGRVRA